MLRRLIPQRLYRAAQRRRALMRDIAAGPLHRGSALAATLRYLRLQRVRGTGTYPMVPYVGGAVLAWPAGASSVDMQAKYGLGEPYDMGFSLHLLRPDDLFCDVGANAGVYTVLASKAVGARSVSFEPVPRTFSLLMQNVWANDIGALVDARQCGVGREPGALHFTSDLWSFNHVAERDAAGAVEVPVVTLDQALDGRVPRLIKIDVEGFEGEVVAGARRTLSDPSCAAVIMELVTAVQRYGATREGIAGEMRALGFTPCWYDPFTRTFSDPGERARFRYNQIFVRDFDFVKSRVAQAPTYRVRGLDL